VQLIAAVPAVKAGHSNPKARTRRPARAAAQKTRTRKRRHRPAFSRPVAVISHAHTSQPLQASPESATAKSIVVPASRGESMRPARTGPRNTAATTGGVGLRAAREAVRRRLEAFKYYPASARRRGIEGDVDVAFSLVAGGMAARIKLLKGSGYAVLDRAALATVARAQPFPVERGDYRFRLRFRRL